MAAAKGERPAGRALHGAVACGDAEKTSVPRGSRRGGPREVGPATFGARLRAAREAADLGPEVLAQRYGMTLARLERVEDGRREPGITAQIRLANALGVPITELVVLPNLRLSADDARRVGDIGRALAHPLRARIAAVLMFKPELSPVEVRALLADQQLGSVSYHLRALEKDGFVECTRRDFTRGTVRHYYALRAGLRSALVALGGTFVDAERNADLLSKIGKGLANPTRAKIGAILMHSDEVSPIEMAGATGIEIGTISYHVRYLANENLIEAVGHEPRRGAIQHYYAARPELSDVLAALVDTLDEPKPRASATETIWKLGQNLRAARRRAGLTVNDVAATSQLDADEVAAVEEGHDDPTIGVVLKLARAVHAPVLDLLDDVR